MSKSKSKRNKTAGQRAATQRPSIKDVADQMNADKTPVGDDGHPDVPPDVPPEEVAIEEGLAGEPTPLGVPEGDYASGAMPVEEPVPDDDPPLPPITDVECEPPSAPYPKPGARITAAERLAQIGPQGGWIPTKGATIKRCRVFDATPAPECFEVGRRDSDHSGVTLPPRIVTSIARIGNDTHITFETNGVKSRSVLVNVPVELQYEDKKGDE